MANTHFDFDRWHWSDADAEQAVGSLIEDWPRCALTTKLVALNFFENELRHARENRGYAYDTESLLVDRGSFPG